MLNLYFQNATKGGGGGWGMVRILASFLCSVDHVGCCNGKHVFMYKLYMLNGDYLKQCFLHTICIYMHMCLLIIVLTNHRPINIYYFCGYNQQYVRRSLNIKWC